MALCGHGFGQLCSTHGEKGLDKEIAQGGILSDGVRDAYGERAGSECAGRGDVDGFGCRHDGRDWRMRRSKGKRWNEDEGWVGCVWVAAVFFLFPGVIGRR